jgi:hypothetical protein
MERIAKNYDNIIYDLLMYSPPSPPTLFAPQPP